MVIVPKFVKLYKVLHTIVINQTSQIVTNMKYYINEILGIIEIMKYYRRNFWVVKKISNTIAFNEIPKIVKYTKYHPYQLSLLPVSYIKYLKFKKKYQFLLFWNFLKSYERND